MSKKVYIRYGHDILTTGSCTAASGILSEYSVITAYAAKVASKLESAGYTVKTGGHTNKVYATASAALTGEVSKANSWGADIFVSLHANAGGGTGTEVYYYSTSSVGKSLATNISSKVATALGLTNRGAKTGNSYYEIKNTSMPAVIVEPFFVDTQADCTAYNNKGAATLAAAIVNGIKAAYPNS